MKFHLGSLVGMKGVADLMESNQLFSDFVAASLKRYIECDWGDLCKEDRKLSDNAVKHGDRIMGSYPHPACEEWKVWIITEWDRSVTTVLFPREY
ncbi:MAG: hypothetical protein RR475_02415 [Clostridia bacterium]